MKRYAEVRWKSVELIFDNARDDGRCFQAHFLQFHIIIPSVTRDRSADGYGYQNLLPVIYKDLNLCRPPPLPTSTLFRFLIDIFPSGYHEATRSRLRFCCSCRLTCASICTSNRSLPPSRVMALSMPRLGIQPVQCPRSHRRLSLRGS